MAKPTALKLSNLQQLDSGIIARAFDRELQKAVTDCIERPADARPRKVYMVLSLKPKVDLKAGEVHADDVLMETEVASSLPKMRSKTFTMKPKANGDLSFHPDLADDPEGDALFDEDVRERERGEGKGE